MGRVSKSSWACCVCVWSEWLAFSPKEVSVFQILQSLGVSQEEVGVLSEVCAGTERSGILVLSGLPGGRASVHQAPCADLQRFTSWLLVVRPFQCRMLPLPFSSLRSSPEVGLFWTAFSFPFILSCWHCLSDGYKVVLNPYNPFQVIYYTPSAPPP